MQLKHVLFDLDGTLLDTAPDLANALNLMLKRHARPALPYSLIRPYVSKGATGLLELGFDIKPSHPDYIYLREEYLQIYADNIFCYTTFFPHVLELLQELVQKKVLWGIVTNKPDFLTQSLLEKVGIQNLTPCIVSGNTCKNPKPSPAPLLHACDLLNINPVETLYIGDNQCDVIAAKNANMPVAIVNYGYLMPEDSVKDWQADIYLNHILEVLNILKITSNSLV